MKWKNAVRDFLPTASDTVLVSLRGVYHLAVFDGGQQVFIVDYGKGRLELRANDDQLYWTELTKDATK